MKFRLAALVGVVAALLIPGTAHATDPTSITTEVISSPDDGDPAWARDSFTRVTKFTEQDGTWLVEIHDDGEFTTGTVTGNLLGSAKFVVTGNLLDPLPATDVDNTSYATKADVPAAQSTSQWWKRFFADNATSPGITGWEWTYSRCSGDAKVTRTENESGVKGASYDELKEAVCPTPTATPTAAPTDPATGEPSSTPAAPADEETLPVTGSDAGLIAGIGGSVLLAGAVVFIVARRRRHRFTA